MVGVPTAPIPPGVSLHALAVTTSDTTVYNPPLSKLYVGGSGNLAILMAGDTVAVTLQEVVSGTLISDVGIISVLATGTTASNLVGFR